MTARAIAAMALAAAVGLACDASPVERTSDPPLTPSTDSCSGARPDFGGLATAADRALFSYDVDAPLNLQRTVESTNDGVEVSRIAFTTPDGGLVAGLMWDPVTRWILRPGMVLLHGHPASARDMSGIAQEYARHGAVVVAIDAPFARRTGGPVGLTFPPQDRAEQIQLIKDLQRAVDVLLAQPNVDPTRIAFSGFSYGGMVAFHFAGIERRVRAGVITAGYGGSLTIATDRNGIQMLGSVSCATRNAWFRDMIPIEGIRYIAGASPTALLFQIARFDTAVLPEDAQAAYDAAPSPKEVLYYDTGHGFSPQANQDRWAWLAKQIGIDP